MMYVLFLHSLRIVEDLLHKRGNEIWHETVRFWWNSFGPLFAVEIRKCWDLEMWSRRLRWHLEEACRTESF